MTRLIQNSRPTMLTSALFGIVAVSIVFYLTASRADSVDSSEVAPISVIAATALANNTVDEVATSAILESVSSAFLSIQASGEVTRRVVEIGAEVQAGAILLEFDSPSARPAFAAARSQRTAAAAEADFAAQEYARFKALLQNQAVSQQEYDAVKSRHLATAARLEQADAEVELRRAQLEELSLKAPFAGAVTEINVDTGDVVAPGQPLMRLSGAQQLEARVAVPPRVARSLSVGDTVPVRSLLDTNRLYEGAVADIARFAERSAVPQVVVSIKAQELAAGTPVEIQFTLPPTGGVRIPLRAVFRSNDQQPSVFKIVGGVAKVTPIIVSEIDDGEVIVQSGLEVGDVVVLEGRERVFEGATVEISR